MVMAKTLMSAIKERSAGALVEQVFHSMALNQAIPLDTSILSRGSK